MATAPFSCDYTTEEIKNLDFIECVDILESNCIDIKLLEELEELQDLIIKHLELSKQCENVEEPQAVSGEANADSKFSSSSDLLNEMVSRDREIKVKLNDVYKELSTFFEMEQYTSDPALQREIEIEFPNVQQMVRGYSEELMSDECPIVVTGETSAGKSSLLNLIIGSKILPSSLLSNTSTVCRIRNQKQKIVRVFDQTGQNLVFEKEFEDDIGYDELRKELKKYICCENNPYGYVDISWPIPSLGHQVIVDTPGIGENKQLTSRLLGYLPRAVALIYVINSENAGGVQQDRLLKILENQQKWRDEGRKQTFDSNCTLFVCNKWDGVPNSEQDRVWEDTKEKLNYWPGFTESQMFRLSTLMSDRRYRSGLDYPEDFQNFMRGFQKMVENSFQENEKQHERWQHRLLQRILFHVTTRINNMCLNQEEKRVQKEKIEERLRRLEHDTEEVKKKYEDEAKRICEAIGEKLHAHIHDQKTVNKIKQWNKNDIPVRESDMDLIKNEAKEKIRAKIGREIKIWSENERLNDINTELAMRFKEDGHLLEEQCQEVDNQFANARRSVDLEDIADDVVEDEKQYLSIPNFSITEKLALGITAPLWIPLFTLVGTATFIVRTVVEYYDTTKYLKNKTAFMDKWADEVLSMFSREEISKQLDNIYTERFRTCLNQLCDVVIPRQIKSDRELIVNIRKEERSTTAIRRQYQPLVKRSQAITGKLFLVGKEYFYSDQIMDTNIIKGDILGKGSFATVYKTEVLIGEERKRAAVKCMTQPLEYPDSYSQLSEVKTLTESSFDRIVKLYGVSYEEIGSQKYLQIIMELCDFTLSSQIFPGNGDIPAPLSSCSELSVPSTKMNPQLTFFKRVAMDICLGLEYLHKKNLIHRDLKPSNILLKDNRAKIADVGLTKETDFTTGTLAGTAAYIAPEVIMTKVYGTEVDIYSLGVLLWELWYGARAYQQVSPEQIFEQLMAGHRPNFHKRHAPPHALKELIKQCWHEDPKCRPEAGQIYVSISQDALKRSHYGLYFRSMSLVDLKTRYFPK